MFNFLVNFVTNCEHDGVGNPPYSNTLHVTLQGSVWEYDI